MCDRVNSHILSGAKDDYHIPKESFGKIIFECLQKRDPNDVINIHPITKEFLTCGRLLEESVKLTTALQGLGLQKDDVITIVSANTINYVIPILAAFYIGVTVNPMNPGYSEEELMHGLLISRPKIIFCSEHALETVLKAKRKLNFVKTILLMGCKKKCSNINNYEDLLETVSTDVVNNFLPKDLDYANQVAFVVSSSGTTGLPKGVMITHQNLRITVGGLSHPRYGNTTAKDTTVVVVPFFHIYGPLLQILGLVTSMKCIVMEKFNPDIFLKAIEEYRATKLFIVPALINFLAKSPMVDNYNLSSLKDIYVGTAPLGKELQDTTAKRLDMVTIKQIYGLSETAGPITFQTDTKREGSVGVLIPGMTGKVWDPDTGENLGPFKNGEICLKGPAIMKGYIPGQNFLDQDGFFHSGDVGYYDDDGFLYIVDRMKEMIKYKSFQVSPAELEALIITHKLVKDCGVIGIPNEKAGELPLAFVVLEHGADMSQQEIVDFVSERISKEKRLYGGVRFVDEIPRTPSGKIMRRKLVEIFKTIF